MPRALRDALGAAVCGTTGQTVPGDQPGRTQDTGDRADGTAVRGRAKAQGIEVKHRRRVPAEPLIRVQGRDWTAKSRTSQPARLCRLTLMPKWVLDPARISMYRTAYSLTGSLDLISDRRGALPPFW